MRDRGMGQAALARKLGAEVNRQHVHKLMTGEITMSAAWAQKIAPLFKMDWAAFLAEHLPQQAAAAVEAGVPVRGGSPKPGDPIQDDDEAALIGLWRRLSIVKKATIFDYLGFDELPSLREQAALRRQGVG